MAHQTTEALAVFSSVEAKPDRSLNRDAVIHHYLAWRETNRPKSGARLTLRRSMSISVPTATRRCQWRTKQNTRIGILPKICRSNSSSKPAEVRKSPVPLPRTHLEHFQRDEGGSLVRSQMPRGSKRVRRLLRLTKDEGNTDGLTLFHFLHRNSLISTIANPIHHSFNYRRD